MLCFFLLFWAGMIVIGAIGFKFGKPQRLVYGTDYKGRTCGTDAGVEGNYYITYPRTTEDLILNSGVKNPLDYKFYGICTKKCPAKGDIVCNYEVPPPADAVDCLTRFPYPSTSSNGVPCSQFKDNCWYTPQSTSSTMYHCLPDYEATGALNSICVFPVADPPLLATDSACVLVQDTRFNNQTKPAQPNLLFDQLQTTRQVWGRYFGDLNRAWWVILLCSVAITIFFGYVWMFMLKYCTGFIVWVTIFLMVVSFVLLTGFFYWKAGILAGSQLGMLSSQLNAVTSSASQLIPQSFNDNESNRETYKWIAYVSTGFCVILVLIIAALRTSIRTAIAVIKLGAEAVKALPSLLLMPLTNVAAISLFGMWWIFVAAALATSGTITTSSLEADALAGYKSLCASAPSSRLCVNQTTVGNLTISSVSDMKVNNYLLIYHCFGLLWTANFIQGITVMTIAGAVCGWYFSLNETGNPEVEKYRYTQGRLPVFSSLYRTCRYYLGTVALGSLLIGIVQFIRACCYYLQRQLKGNQNNKALQWAFCCIQCCLKMLQSLVEMITRNAYILVALKDISFCTAGRRVFSLILNNAATLAVVNVLGEIIMFIAKITISIAAAFFAYLIIERHPDFMSTGKTPISSSWMPVLATLFFSYIVASGFLVVFDLSVDTVLVCYVVDIEENAKRGGGAVPGHVKADKLHIKERVNAQKLADSAEPVRGTKAAAPTAGTTAGTATAPSVSAAGAPSAYGKA